MAVVGLLTLQIHIEHSHSLKDKRRVLRALKDRLRKRYNVAAAELEYQDTWQDAVVGVCTLSSTQAQVERVLKAAEHEAEELLGPSLTTSEWQLF